MDMAEVADVLDEDRPQETPGRGRGDGARGPGADRLHLRHHRRAARRRPRLPLPVRPAIQAEHWFGSRKGELAWCTTATGWSKSARNVFLAPWLTGAAAVIHDGRFDPAERLDLAEALGVNVLCQAPTEYRMLARRTTLRPLPALRRMVSAGEPLDPETIAAFREATGLEPADGYGQTETGQVTGNLAGEAVRQGSMGKPLPGIETRIVEGELQLRAASSPTFFSRYLDGERFEGEWWPTGDLVSADEDGYLFFEGRDDDIILSSGYRIGPTEVEAALLSHPAVAEAAAVAAPDPERGAVVRAIVVLREREPGEELVRELQEHCKARDRAVQVPPHRRVRRRAADDEQRQDQAGAAARGVISWRGHERGNRRRGRRPRLLRSGRPARPRRDDRVLRAGRQRRDPRPGRAGRARTATGPGSATSSRPSPTSSSRSST